MARHKRITAPPGATLKERRAVEKLLKESKDALRLAAREKKKARMREKELARGGARGGKARRASSHGSASSFSPRQRGAVQLASRLHSLVDDEEKERTRKEEGKGPHLSQDVDLCLRVLERGGTESDAFLVLSQADSLSDLLSHANKKRKKRYQTNPPDRLAPGRIRVADGT